MDIERLLEEAIESGSRVRLDALFNAILDEWLYFYFFELNGADTKPGEDNVEVVLAVDKSNPINIPAIKNEEGTYGVLYTNLDIAKKSAEFNCKIGKMKGKKAFNMFYEVKNIDSVYIQGNCGYILPKQQELKKLAGNA